MQNKLLLEILTEEVPYTLQKQAMLDINDLFAKALSTNLITYSNINVYATSRRLTILIDNIAEYTTTRTEEKKGPAIDAQPQAIEGFLKKNNLTKDQLTIKNGCYFATIVVNSTLTKDIIANIITTEILAQLKFKKSMHWNESKVYWARPILNLLCILQINNITNIISNLQYANVTATNYTFGHRFLGQQSNPISISSISNYFNELKNNYVILDPTERKEIILQHSNNIAKKYNGRLLNNWVLDEVVFLNEYPVILESVIPQKYLQLPKELLITIMANNQRYLNIIDNNGNLLPNFIIVSNNKASDNGIEIIKGNNKVLVARLEDGLFFYNLDTNKPLEKNIDKLKTITYFEGLGSYADKIDRMLKLFNQLSQSIFTINNTVDLNDIKTAITLSKADLASEIIKEVPELQGIMGGYYYEKYNNNTQIAQAIKQHYKPQGPNDSLPTNTIGVIVSFIDKLDTLEQLFSIGKQPTGNGDPYALRRAALGLIRLITKTENVFNTNFYFSDLTKNKTLQDFLQDRLQQYIVDNYNISKDLVKKEYNVIYNIAGIRPTVGLFALYGNNQYNSIVETKERIEKFILSTTNNSIIQKLQNLSNINLTANDITQSLFTTPQEHNLYTDISGIYCNNLILSVNNLFNIKVIDDNTNVTNNRLNMLLLAYNLIINHLLLQANNYLSLDNTKVV